MVLPKSIITVQATPLFFGASPAHFDLFAASGLVHEAAGRDKALIIKGKTRSSRRSVQWR